VIADFRHVVVNIRTKVPIKIRPVILSGAFFSGVEGPAFGNLTTSQPVLNE
jgi:hypothetical protein